MNEAKKNTIEQTNDRLHEIFDTDDPLVKEYLANGPVRTKSSLIKDKKHWLKVDIKNDRAFHMDKSDEDQLRYEKRDIKRVASFPCDYVLILNQKQTIPTAQVVGEVVRSIRLLRKSRLSKIQSLLKGNLPLKDLKVLKSALDPAAAPRGKKTVYRKLSRVLGLNKIKD